MANIITSLRIVCAILIFSTEIFSLQFYILYIDAGISDILDGAVARRCGIVSEFGSKLDTFADFIFVIACIFKILPVLNLNVWLWIWIVIIAIIKIGNIIIGFAIYKKFVAEHTIMNKLTGLLLFIFPLTLNNIDLKYSTFFICIIATFAAIQEGYLIKKH